MRQYMRQITWILLFVCVSLWGSRRVSAEEYGDVVQWKDRTIAVYNEDGEMMYRPVGDDGTLETQALNYLLGSDREKTLMIPEGTMIKLNRELTIGSNTTLLATGVTFHQMEENAGILNNRVTDADYRSLENVVIQGGVWRSKHKKKKYPLVCLMQASNIQMEDMTMITDMPETGIKLIACKNLAMTRCEVRCRKTGKTKKADRTLAALELDPAVSLLTDGLKSVINEDCMNGQTCQNIKLEKCIIHGRRGIYASGIRQKKYRNQLHSRIRIWECTVTGTDTEAVLLENTVGFSMKNNLMITHAGQGRGIHATGVLVQLVASKGKTRQLSNRISGNVVYGVNYGIAVRSKTKCRYGKITVSGNRSHVNTSGSKAMQIKHCTKKIIRKNKAYI